jgi:hypothetical protein
LTPKSEARPVTARTAEDLRAAITARIQPDGHGCLLWSGGTDKDGYPKIRINSVGNARQVHRIHWEQEIGAIPEGFQLSRLSSCPNRLCIAPAHLVLTKGPLTAARAAQSRLAQLPTFKCGHNRAKNTLKEGGCRICRLAYLRVYNSTRPGRSKLIDVPAAPVGRVAA